MFGAGPPESTYLNVSAITYSNDIQNALYGTSLSTAQYIERSIRDPSSYVVTGFTPDMSAEPTIMDMPQQDLEAIRTYIMTIP